MRTQLSAVIVAFALTSASPAAAQVANTGSVQVIVEDSDGGRLPGVTVSAEAADTITRRTAVTDAEGVASLEALAPSAQYVITAELQGFTNGRQQQILVRAGQSATLTLTLAGGKRNFQGLEFVFRKRFSNNWQVLSSYNWNDAKGNSNSDGNADFQGDVLFLDPRAPNQYGTQPGLIRHVAKGAGSYTFPFGLQLGATATWNSGTVASRTFLSSSRNLPLRVPASDAYLFGGITDRWLAPDSVGSLTNPSWGQLDLRVQYVRNIRQAAAEVFVDLFNVLDNQGAVRNQDLVAGQGGIAFGQGLQWVQPRRAFLGARVRF